METKLNESNLKLIEFSTLYSKFNKNQVLTETQLNGFLDYFDDQGRLTRTSLNGVGIVCGFKVSLSEDGITITQGRGVTTDGDLVALLNPSLTENGKKDDTLKSLHFQSKTFTHYKSFFDNKAVYKKFLNPEEEQITLYELSDVADDDFNELSQFKTLESSVLSNMYVLLYVESYAKEDDLCNQLTCDNQGIEQIARLRVLLVSKENAEYIANKDIIFSKHNWYETYANLPVVSAPRIVVNPRITRSFARLKTEYFQTLVGSGVLSGLRDGLNSILTKFGDDTIPTSALERVFNFNKTSVPNDFQYRYDSLNDLINTYNQIKELLLEMNVECCPTIGAFPKHLMLGRVVELKEYPTLRHEFYKSPIIPEDDANYQKVMSLLSRVQELIKEFNTGEKGTDIRITPSLDISVLSNKAIPFYYNVTNPLLKYWNFLKSRRFMDKLNLSYHREKLANVPSVQNPLDYNIDGFDFYRIEGHQGKPYKDALREINKLKVDHGLNFDVKVLSIETSSSDFDMQKYKCHFEDLRALFNAWKVEQECILEQIIAFFSAFSTVTPGENWISEHEGYDQIDRIVKRREEERLKELQKLENQKLEKEKLLQQEKDKLLQQLLDKVSDLDKGDNVVVDDKVDQVDKGDDVVKDDIIDRVKEDEVVAKKDEYLFNKYRDQLADHPMHEFVLKAYDAGFDYTRLTKEIEKAGKQEEWKDYISKAKVLYEKELAADPTKTGDDVTKFDHIPDMSYKDHLGGYSGYDMTPDGDKSYDMAHRDYSGPYPAYDTPKEVDKAYDMPGMEYKDPAAYYSDDMTPKTDKGYDMHTGYTGAYPADDMMYKADKAYDMPGIEYKDPAAYYSDDMTPKTDKGYDMYTGYTGAYPADDMMYKADKGYDMPGMEYKDPTADYSDQMTPRPDKYDMYSGYSGAYPADDITPKGDKDYRTPGMAYTGYPGAYDPKDPTGMAYVDPTKDAAYPYAGYEITGYDAVPSYKGDLSDLGKSFDKGEDKVVADDVSGFTKDQLVAQEKELIKKFKEKLRALEIAGESPEVIKKYVAKFEAYLKDFREGKAIYKPTKDTGGVSSLDKASDLDKAITKAKDEPRFEDVVINEDNTIGKIFLQIIRQNPGASLATILGLLERAMTQLSQTQAWRQEPELSRFILKEVVRTLAIAYILDYNLPRDIERLNESAQSTYNEILAVLCEQIKDLQATFSVSKLGAGTQQITEMLMHQLASICCSGKQLKVMYDEIQTRKDSILLKTRLFEFVKNHPGLEHKAGVRPGGTFVMVYLEGDETPVEKTQTSLELKFLEIPEVESVSEEEMILQLWDEDLRFSFRFINQKFAEEAKDELLKEEKAIYSLVPIQEEMTKTISYFADLLNKNFAIRGILNTISAVAKGNLLRFNIQNENVKEGTGYFQTNNEAIFGTSEPYSFKIERSFDDFLQAKDRVVADFSLPYMCCSDCAPVNFIIPKDPPILRLPQEYICLKDGEPVTPIPFSVSPEDGEIEAEVYGGIESGLTFDDDGKAFFDASLTDPSLHGKEIGFKVDGEATNCTIIVYAEPPLSVSSEVQYDDELRTSATVTFTLDPVYPELTHTWSDGLGHTMKIQPNAEGKVVFEKINLPVNEDNILTPTVTISNGFCEKLVEIDPIQFEDPITEVKLEIQPTYCIEDADGEITKIPFSLVDPEGLTIRFANEKVEGLQIAENSLIINPNVFDKFYQPIEFTLGTLPTEASIIIFPAIEVGIDTERGEVIFKDEKYYQEANFKAKFAETIKTESITMTWEVDGVQVGQGDELTHNFLIQETPTKYQIVFKATQEGGCAKEVSTELIVENPNFKLTLPDNRTKYCLNDENAYPITIFPPSEGVVVEGLGVSYDADSDTYLFTPSETGLSVAATVPLSIDGNTYLKLRVDTIAIARFEAKIENNELVVINKSDDADEYRFEIGEYNLIRTTKETLRRSIDKFDQEVIDITLTTVTFCGKDVTKQTDISLKTTLELPVESVCLKEGEEVVPLAFTVLPEGAKVEARVDASLKSGLYYDENRKPFFDASMTDPALYGTPIKFTLDGRETDCFITVYPPLTLTVDPFVSYNDTQTEAEVIFQVSQVYPNVDYIWSDGFGNEESITPGADGKVAFKYNLPVNDSNTLAFGLTLIQGPCPTKIPIEPITFDDPILDFNLSIQNTFCIGEVDGEFAKIPFTNIDPVVLPIEVVGGPLPGLSIDGNDLIIDVATFNQFRQRIEFTLGGNPTGAHITIYPVFQISIDSTPRGLKWVNNQLVATYTFNTILPGGMNVNGLTSQWEVGGQIVSTEALFEYDFPVYQSPMAYEVRLRVLQDGGCPIETSTIINVEYPEFFMSVPNNRLEYCSNDSESYEITLNPPVEGAVIEGLGMSQVGPENTNVFTPDQADLPAGGPVPLSFNGLIYLILNVTSIPEARFTVEVVNGEVIVTNNSDTADQYIFMVADKEYTYTTRRSIKRTVDSFETSTIDVTLRTLSPCGEGYAKQKGIKIKDDQTEDPVDTGNCAADTLKRIENDNNNLPKVADLNLPPDVEYTVVDQTQTLYDNAQVSGTLTFSDLPTFGILFSDTGSNIFKLRGDDKVRKVLSEYLVAQVKLFFNLLHCQPHEKLRTEEQNIMGIMSGLLGVLNNLRTNQIQYDANKELENFLKNYMISIEVIQFIKDFIKEPLLPEVEASNHVF
jgi:hypothetical protein